MGEHGVGAAMQLALLCDRAGTEPWDLHGATAFELTLDRQSAASNHRSRERGLRCRCKRTSDDAISLRGSNVPAMIDTLNEFFTTPGNIDSGEMISAVGRGIVSLICERLRLHQGREETGAHQLPGDAGSAFWHPRVRD